MKTAVGVEKPLAEWTLKEAKDWHTEKCEHQVCETCPFGSICSYPIGVWGIEKKSKFTEQEIEDAKAVKRILGDGYIRRAMWDFIPQLRLVKTHSYYVFEEDLFPSIKVGEKYKLDEIIGGSDA